MFGNELSTLGIMKGAKPSSRRQPEPPTNQQSLARPRILPPILMTASNNKNGKGQQQIQEQSEQQEEQAHENARVEFVRLHAYIEEKRRIMKLYDKKKGFRDEKAAIMSRLRTADGNNQPHERQPEEEATEQQSIISSSRRIPASSSSAETTDATFASQSLSRRFQRREMMENNDDSRTRSVANDTLFTKTVEQEQQPQDSQQVTFDENETNQSQHRLSVSEEHPFATAGPLPTSPINDGNGDTRHNTNSTSLTLFQRRRQAKARSPNTPQAEVPGAVHVDHPTDIPPEWSRPNNNNNNTFDSNRVTRTLFQEGEPLDPLMDDLSVTLTAGSQASMSPQHEDVSFGLVSVDEETPSFGINNVTNIGEVNKRKKKKVHRIVAVVVFVIVFSLSIGLGSVGLSGSLRDDSSSRQAPILNNTCEIDYSAICKQQDQEGMEMGTFVVPDCARTTYQTLIHEFFSNSSIPSSSLSVAITNATNNTDIDTRIFQPCEPSFLALLSLAITTTSSTTSMNYQVEKYRQDYFALATLYFSTGGPNWNIKDNWLMDPDICVWFGVSCLLDDPKKSLTEIKLNGNNLVGSLPSEIALMMNLRSLIIENNRFLGGTIPTEIGTMQQLGHLSLFTTSVEGTIPTEIGNCQSLRFLIIQSDMLSGSIPSELGQLRDSLDTLELESLSLTGTIPTELGMLNKMIYLALAVNGVSGTFPSEMAKLTSLETLVVNGAQLQVTELSSHLLGLTKLRTLILFDSIFATTFPSTISQLSSLENLGLIKNSFHGTLPTELGLLTNLTELRLNEQDFIGQLPTQLGKLTKLTNLDLSNIGITGSLPSELGLLSNLSEFILAGNFFSGTLPSELCSLKENIVFDNDDFLLGEQPFIKDNCESSQRI